MTHILIVGKKFSGLVNYLVEHGYDYTEIRDVKTTKYPDKKFKHRILADFSSKENVLKAVEKFKDYPDLAAIASCYETSILPCAWIAEHLNIPGLPVAAAEACTDKYLMRSLFAKSPEKISPDFAEVTSVDTIKEFARNHEFPLILKPANLAKSLLVTKSMDMDELMKNYERTVVHIDSVYKKYAPDRKPKIIIEEFLEGSVHSVDAFIDKDGVPHVMKEIVDYQTGYEVGYDDNFHYSRLLPSKLSVEQQAAFLRCAELGCKALGMKSSPAHIEIIMTKNGPQIVEIGARNGGYRDRMYHLANDIDINGNALTIALGEQPEITARKNEPVAVLELFPMQPGKFKKITNQEALERLPSLESMSVKAVPGQYVGKSSDGYKMVAVVILHNKNNEQFNTDLDFVNNNVRVVTE